MTIVTNTDCKFLRHHARNMQCHQKTYMHHQKERKDTQTGMYKFCGGKSDINNCLSW